MNGESTSMVWPTLGSRAAKEQNRTMLALLLVVNETGNRSHSLEMLKLRFRLSSARCRTISSRPQFVTNFHQTPYAARKCDRFDAHSS